MNQLRPENFRAVINDATTPVPPHGIMRVVSIDSDGFSHVNTWDTSVNLAKAIINGDCEIPVSSASNPGLNYGNGHAIFPAVVAYDTSTSSVPAAGETWGPTYGSWKLTKRANGFYILGAGTSDGFVNTTLLPQELYYLAVTSVTKTAGAYPATRYALDATTNPQTWTSSGETAWLKTTHASMVLGVGSARYWVAKLAGVKSADGLFIYEATEFARFIRGTLGGTLTQGGSQTITLSDGQTPTVYDDLLLTGQTVASTTVVHANWDDLTSKYWASSAACATS